MPCPDCGHKYHIETCTATISMWNPKTMNDARICQCNTIMFAGSTAMLVRKRAGHSYSLGDYLFRMVGGFGGVR